MNIGKYKELKKQNKTAKKILKAIKNAPDIFYDKEFNCNCVFIDASNFSINDYTKEKVNSALSKMGAWLFFCSIISPNLNRTTLLKVCWVPQTNKHFSPVPQHLKHVPAKNHKRRCYKLVKSNVSRNGYFVVGSISEELQKYFEYKGLCVERCDKNTYSISNKPKAKKGWFAKT